jgi:hypothetical protein
MTTTGDDEAARTLVLYCAPLQCGPLPCREFGWYADPRATSKRIRLSKTDVKEAAHIATLGTTLGGNIAGARGAVVCGTLAGVWAFRRFREK